MRNKVFVLPPGEGWIVDRMCKEWSEDNSDITTDSLEEAKVVWLLADWCWRKIPASFLREKKVITTVHHIVPEKFGANERLDFSLRDQFTTVYHVFNQSTLDFISPLTSKKIQLIPYWANQKIWKKSGEKSDLRGKYGIPKDAYVVGSFQRDTEGHDLKSPKLEKGPDILADYLTTLKDKNLFVVLAGWRRQYIMSRLDAEKIPYKYLERPSHEIVNDLYQCLDLYPVTARTEGGPQALIECGLLNVPVVSRDVGIASQVLHNSSINNDITRCLPSVPDVSSWTLPKGYSEYRSMVSGLME